MANALPEYCTIVESDRGMQERLSLEDASSFLEAVILNPLRKVPVPASQRVLVHDARAVTADGLILAGDARGKLHKIRFFESLR